MKPKPFHFLLLQAVLLPALLFAQNIGIGTTTPVMKLHISSGTDTALLQIDNTNPLAVNTNSGVYFRNGLYYTGAIKAIGTGAVFARLAFYTFAATDQNAMQERMSIADDGRVAIGLSEPEAKLDINGDIKIRGGVPGNSKVLTSDAFGLASWQLPPAANTGFKAVVNAGGFNVSSSTVTPIIFTTEDYDDPNAFFSTEYFAPSAGLYHFDARVTWDIIGVAFNTQYQLVGTLNGFDIAEDVMQVPGGSGSRVRSQSLSFDVKLIAGQRIALYALQDSGIIQTILGISGTARLSYFCGRKVY